ncbi:MAG: SIMPL domain-containing protein, partial [Bacteroidales bacterium]|nr:SIMPL domain-containing protein [Bacteroidales bacterium]
MQITEGTRKVVAAVIYGVAIVVGLGLLAGAYRKTHPTEEKINVTGMASKDIVSDLIAWDGNMQRKNMSLQEAYAQLAADTKLVKEYLSEHGIADNEVVFSAVDISKENEYRNDGNGHYYYVFSGYQLSQRVHVESKDIEKVEEIARNVTSLI